MKLTKNDKKICWATVLVLTILALGINYLM